MIINMEDGACAHSGKTYVDYSEKEDISGLMRVCGKCGDDLNLLECYHKNPQQSYGRHLYCKKCRSKKGKKGLTRHSHTEKDY